jgi:AcrR family transcriptional regulator
MRAKDRRRQLLEVAADLFARRGYRGTTTAELARSAGITEPILYRHFQNKLELFTTLVDEVGREVIRAWQAALEGVTDPARRLRILLAGNPATNPRGRGVYRVIFQAMTEMESDAEIRAALKRHVVRLHRFLATELTRLQAAGAVRTDEPPAALAWLLIDIAIGFGLLHPLEVGSGRTMAQRMIRELVSPPWARA